MPQINAPRPKQFNDRGPFDNTVDYITKDAVSFGGNLYVAPVPILAGGGNPNPGTNLWANHPGSAGTMGNIGTKGDGVRAVYIRVAEGVTPDNPTGTWDGVSLILGGGWQEGEPSGSGILWRSDVELDSTANTATFTTAERWTGVVGPRTW